MIVATVKLRYNRGSKLNSGVNMLITKYFHLFGRLAFVVFDVLIQIHMTHFKFILSRQIQTLVLVISLGEIYIGLLILFVFF